MTRRNEEDASAARHDPEFWNSVEEAFAVAVAAPESGRAGVLDDVCGARADVRLEVESLLRAHARAGAFITPATVGAGPAFDAAVPSLIGMRIGAFRLVERVGCGGMGDVYRAERVEGEFTQQVAIKLLGARIHDADVLRRFQAERQILASLHHPNIVGLLDGGVTAGGQPYIVMEFVDGVTLTEYCRRQSLSIEQRLGLMLQVITAVRFAHRHLVVHRDLKPANLLVTHDGVVKVLDFGVAKLLAPGHPDAGTTSTLMAPMTPNYASPEQLRGLPATTACDVYALGLLLYEVLTGSKAYDTSHQTWDQIVGTVVNGTPGRPSSARGDGVPYPVRRLRGDIDAIVMKAMARLPEERYPSAEELGEDVSRALDGRPVNAREPSFAYVTRRLVRRHRLPFAIAAVSLVLLLAALVGAVWQARVAAAERERAVRRYNDVRELAGALIFRIHDEVSRLQGSTPVRQTLITEAVRFLERLEQDAGQDPALRAQLAAGYVRIGHVQGRQGEANLGDRPGAIRSYKKGRDLAAPLLGRDATGEAVETFVNANMGLAGVLEPGEAVAASAAALAQATDWHARSPDDLRRMELLARARFHMAMMTQPPHALAHWHEADRLFHAILSADPENLNRMRNAALTQKYLGSQYEQKGELDPALAHYRRALDLDRQRVDRGPEDRQAQLDLAIDIGNVANVHLKRGEHAEALAAYERSLALRQRIADADPKDVHAKARVAFVYTKLATLNLRAGRLAVARQQAQHAITLNEPLNTLGAGLRDQQARALKTLGDVEWLDGRRPAACSAYIRAGRLIGDDARSNAGSTRGTMKELEPHLARCAPSPH